MKALLIGGTGTISSAITRQLAQNPDWELYLFNRGNRSEEIPLNVKVIKGDIQDEEQAAKLLEGMKFDCVAEFTGFVPEQVERDIRLFEGKTKQFIYISSAAAYHTPPSRPFMTEGMLLKNPYWKYARDKIACEEVLLKAFREKDFPVTIVRPSHTYCERMIPFTSLWTITFNEDFAKGFIGLMGNPHAIGEAVHITTDEVLTWDQMAQAVADALDVEYKPYYLPTDVLTALDPAGTEGFNGDKRHSVIYDNTKLKQLVPGYKATISWRTGVDRALKYIMQHPELQTEDPEFDSWCDTLMKIYDEALEEAKKQCRR